MSRFPRRRPDRVPAERVRGGAGAHSQDDLARLLAAGSASAHPHELAGEEAVMSAFRKHHVGQARPQARRRLVPTTVAKFLTVKVALASTVAVAATGGVALAATTGALPESLGGARWTGTPARPHATPQPSTPAGARATGSPTSSPSDLCRAYRARAGEIEGGMLDDPLFQSLIEVAGGRNDVAGYCDALLTPEDDGDQRPPAPGGSGPPDGKPAHPTGKPTNLPGKPTSLPGRPDKPAGGPATATPADQSGLPMGQPDNRGRDRRYLPIH